MVVSLQSKYNIVLHKFILGDTIYFAKKGALLFEIERY